MAGRIFDPENDFFRGVAKFTDLLVLSFFWAVCSIPIFTLGPATAALYHAVNKSVRGDSRYGWTLFFQSFKANFKVGALTSLITAAIAALLVVLGGLFYTAAFSGEGAAALYMAYCVLMLLPLGWLCYLFPVLSRFTFGVRDLMVTCAKLAIAHLPSTVAMAVLLALSVYVCSRLLMLPVLIVPGLLAWAHSLFLERIFRPYMQGEEGEGQAEETGTEN